MVYILVLIVFLILRLLEEIFLMMIGNRMGRLSQILKHNRSNLEMDLCCILFLWEMSSCFVFRLTYLGL